MEEILSRCVDSMRETFAGEENSIDLIERVSDIMPIEEESYKILNVRGTLDRFKAKISASIESEESFIKLYCEKNNETLRIHTSNKRSRYYRCKHRTRNEKTREVSAYLDEHPGSRLQNTNCKFSMSIKPDPKSPDFNTIIDIEWNHNHSTKSLHSLTYKDISNETKLKVQQLFNAGLLPGATHKELMRQLRSECQNDLEYEEKVADRSIIPRRPDINRLYGQFTKEMFGSTNVSGMFEKLEEKIEELQETSEDYTFRFVKHSEKDSQPLILVVITPLMKRVHCMVENSKDMVFIDSSSNMEEFNLRIFLIVTHSVAGALPLGIIVTSDEQLDTLKQAFELFKESVITFGFFNSAEDGPQVIMTDNCDELREALLSIWPLSTLLLCIYHILQQVWRWVHDTKNGIPLDQRPHVLTLFKRVLYASTNDEMEEAYDEFLGDDIVVKYPKLIKYIKSVYEDNSAWALCHRKDLPIRGNDTNNYVEAQFMVIKDDILKRQKEVNIVGLLSKLTNELDMHYKNKLLSISSGKYDGIYSRRFNALGKAKGENARKSGTGFLIPTREEQDKVLNSIIDLGNNNFLIESFSIEGMKYLVDMNSGLCQCYEGINGSSCKHQYVIWANKLSESLNFIPRFCPQQKQKFSRIALGSTLNLEMYEGIHDRVVDSRASVPLPNHEPMESTSSTSISICNESSRPLLRRNKNNDDITLNEAFEALDKATEILKKRLTKNSHQQCLRGIMKFSDRVINYPISKLTSGFHAFATPSTSSTKILASSILKKSKSRKIFVQPTAVKRRKAESGSRNKYPKGQKTKNHLKPNVPNKKRTHDLASNVRDNVPAPKKAGRSMASKTSIRIPKAKVAKSEEAK